MRNNESILQLSDVIQGIVNKKDILGENIDSKEIIMGLKQKEAKISKLMKSTLPKVSRWSNLTTMLSIPVAVAGAYTKQPLLMAAGGLMTVLFFEFYRI